MSLDWIFAAEIPLPAGLVIEKLSNSAQELGDLRISEAEGLLGRETARSIAKKLGAYELEEEMAQKLELEGLKLGAHGEFSALTPVMWGRPPGVEAWGVFTARLAQSGAVIYGLQLTKEQREAFLQFLSRNRVDIESTPLEMVELARHFFFGEPINVVVRYTGPRFHHS